VSRNGKKKSQPEKNTRQAKRADSREMKPKMGRPQPAGWKTSGVSWLNMVIKAISQKLTMNFSGGRMGTEKPSKLLRGTRPNYPGEQ